MSTAGTNESSGLEERSDRPFEMPREHGAPERVTVDANEAVAWVAHRMNEVIAIYPITPASPMGELADAWSVEGRTNLWGQVPEVVEMQSEGGAAGAVHGALQAGAVTTTFTASQGLLLMIPNLYKIAGELTPCVIHVAARTVATHALSIFGDHSDVMAARGTGFAMLCSGSVQEAHDFAAVAQAATFAGRVPFLHFFDGFRTSHEIQKISQLADDDLRALVSEDDLGAHRERALTPDRPVLRGTAQNPDVFFQAREAVNGFYEACPAIVRAAFEDLARRTGRRYGLFDYVGHPQAEHVIVMMGSGAETVHEFVEATSEKTRDEKIGLLKVRLYRPFDVDAFRSALPDTVRRIAVLDRTKEPGAPGEPLYLDVVAAFEGVESRPAISGGRYGLSSKEFDPACVRAVYRELARPDFEESPRREFTVGIVDDVTGLSLPTKNQPIERRRSDRRTEAIFWGLGSDGTVGANRNTIKILGESTDLECQGYFVYDSKKAGAVTVSHLRFGPDPIRSAYLVQDADFVACHQFDFLARYDVLEHAAEGATFLLDSPYGPDDVWDHLPQEVQQEILDKKIDLHVVDAYALAREHGLRGRINTVMQTCFFALAGSVRDVLPVEEAVAKIKDAIRATYGKRGPVVVEQNHAAVDATLERLHRVEIPGQVTSDETRPPVVAAEAPDLVQNVTAVMLAGKGDALPVSAFPADGTWPTGTSRWEKRNVAQDVPIWDPDVCIQCNQCAYVCPHAAIRAKLFHQDDLHVVPDAPDAFRHVPYKAKDHDGLEYVIQVAPEDCTGCRLCYEICPAKDRSNPRHKALEMTPRRDVLEEERQNYEAFLALPEIPRREILEGERKLDAKGSQFLEPLFEYSGACAGCGETPYLKLLTQLFGDRLLVANATGCSSIYGGNLPTTPWAQNADGRGPAWSNSLFEDNAEFGYGFRLAVDALAGRARALLEELTPHLGANDAHRCELVEALLAADQTREADLVAQRERVERLRERLEDLLRSETDDDLHGRLQLLHELADYLVKKSVWLVGGDGWAYDIGYGGLDHVLAAGRDVNILVLDTEVYSNTGGQASKATPLGAAAKFAAAGKELSKKDLGMEAMSYGHVYVARVAFGGNYNQTVRALAEAEAFPGPSLVIAYSPCIAHGYDLSHGVEQQKKAVSSWVWPLYRFDPRRTDEGEPPLQLDCKAPSTDVGDYMQAETRFRMVEKIDRMRYRRFLRQAQHEADRRWNVYRQLAGITPEEGEVS